MSLARQILPLLLAWVLGVALQLSQPQLWPITGYATLLGLGLGLGLLLVAFAVRGRGWTDRAGAALALVVAQGAISGFGLTGARAAWYAQQALMPDLQGQDITVTGHVASLPQRTSLGARFELVVESATLDGQAVPLPRRLLLSW